MSGLAPLSQYIFTVLLSAAVLHGLFLSLLLVRRSGYHIAAILLGTCILFISSMAATFLLHLSGLILEFPHLLAVSFPGFYLIGLLFYFYVKVSIEPGMKWKYTYLLHLIPFILILVFLIPIYTQDTSAKLNAIKQIYQATSYGEISLSSLVFNNGPIIHMLIYAILALNFLIKPKKTFHNSLRVNNTKWLKRFTHIFILLLLSDLIIQLIFWQNSWNPRKMDLILVLSITLYIHLLGYFTLGMQEALPQFILDPNTEKYRTSPLTQPLITVYKQRLLEALEREKPFLNPDLKVGQLAQLIDLPSHQLSEVLNEGLQSNFYDLINHYRVEEIKTRLINPQYHHYSILAIALECGFNNKTTFNRVFKKHTGKTPSSFFKEKNQAK